ncbi:MAG TPA: amidohydrolase family protein [Candidatus Angelobacter sp.]|nr:amidohydrolase family protein [Candidatus Angelobacter sp.]
MKKLAIGFLLLLSLCAELYAQSRTEGPALAITHINVVDVVSGSIQPDMTVVIRGNRILRVGKDNKVRSSKAARVVDGRGKFLIPGLWDMHVHLMFGDWIPGGREVSLPLFVANGVTGVRDMGGDLDTLLAWRKEIAAGTLIGPRMVIAGPMLDGPKPRFPSSVLLTSPEQARKTVDDLKAKGVDFIKVQSFILRDEYFAVVDECRKQHLVLAGHVPDVIRASEASGAGQKSIEHLTGVFEGCSTREDDFLKGPKTPKQFLDSYDEARCKVLIAQFARNHTWQVPTLVWERGQWLVDVIDYSHDPQLKYAPASWQKKSWPSFTKSIIAELDTDPVAARRQFVRKELDVVAAMRKAGVQFMAGTDTAAAVAVLPGPSLHTELEYFVEAGFTPAEALRTATLNPAIFMGEEADHGTVAADKVADLVLLDANPLDDIRNTRRISAVVLNGRLFDRGELDLMLSKIAEFAKSH